MFSNRGVFLRRCIRKRDRCSWGELLYVAHDDLLWFVCLAGRWGCLFEVTEMSLTVVDSSSIKVATAIALRSSTRVVTSSPQALFFSESVFAPVGSGPSRASRQRLT